MTGSQQQTSRREEQAKDTERERERECRWKPTTVSTSALIQHAGNPGQTDRPPQLVHTTQPAPSLSDEPRQLPPLSSPWKSSSVCCPSHVNTRSHACSCSEKRRFFILTWLNKWVSSMACLRRRPGRKGGDEQVRETHVLPPLRQITSAAKILVWNQASGNTHTNEDFTGRDQLLLKWNKNKQNLHRDTKYTPDYETHYRRATHWSHITIISSYFYFFGSIFFEIT